MKVLLFSVLIIAVILIPNYARGQSGAENTNNESILAHPDKKSYVVGEDVIVSGKVSPVIKGEMLRIDVFDPKGAVYKDNIGVASFNQTDGTFSTYSSGGMFSFSHLKLDKDSVKNYGTYKVMVTYNGESKVIMFNVTPTA